MLRAANGHQLHIATTHLHCRILEDNMGTIAIAQEPRIRPQPDKAYQPKILAFRHVPEDRINVNPLDCIRRHLADALTKPLPPETFRRLTTQINRWHSYG